MHRPPLRLFARVLAALVVALASADRLGAQQACASCSPASRNRGQAVTFAVNALIGGVSAGGMRALKGGSFAAGFAAGAAGGGVTYVGKRIAVQPWDGAGLLGREVAALGQSTALDASEGRPLLSYVVLPVGPFHLHVRPRSEQPLRVAVDAASLGTSLYMALLPGTRFDLSESLSAGAVVFHTSKTEAELGHGGLQLAGVIQLASLSGVSQDGVPVAGVEQRLGAHERVHVLQYDQAFILWSVPVEERLMGGSAWSRAVHRYVDLGLNAPLEAAVSQMVPYMSRPWEREAYFLSRTGPDQPGVTF